MGASSHVSVLLKEAVDALAVKKGGRYIDGTFGRGGHAREIAARGGEVLGIDRDEFALENAARKLAFAKERVHLCHGEYAMMKEHALSYTYDRMKAIFVLR